MKRTILIILLSIITSLSHAALVSRLGGLAYYDDVANLTWLADANAAGTTMNWADANTWAAGLNVGGITGWRLPDTVDVDNDGATYTNLYQGVDWGYNITTHSELSNMYYNVLGNLAYFDTSGAVQSGWGLSNTGPFSNLQSSNYWSATEYAPDTNLAWVFNNYDGSQDKYDKTYNHFAWAVHSGDVAPVPEPSTWLLMGIGLLGLVGFQHRKGVKG